MHIGILGTGFGKYHGELYRKIDPSVTLTFWGRNEKKLKEIQSELNCRCTTNIDALLEDDTLDFIDICLPSQVHAEYAIKALNKNHAVFLETPAVTTPQDGPAILNAAKKVNRKVLVNMFLLCDPYYQMIYDLKQNKKYGELKHISIYRRTPPIWGNLGKEQIATALMIHDLDFATWLEKDLALASYSVVTNADQSGAVVDCLLSSPKRKIYVQGNSMTSMGSPFSVGYEAIFEDATISYFDNSFSDSVETACYLYCNNRKTKIYFEPEEHCLNLFKKVLHDFRTETASDLSMENALPALNIAFELSR